MKSPITKLALLLCLYLVRPAVLGAVPDYDVDTDGDVSPTCGPCKANVDTHCDAKVSLSGSGDCATQCLALTSYVTSTHCSTDSVVHSCNDPCDGAGDYGACACTFGCSSWCVGGGSGDGCELAECNYASDCNGPPFDCTTAICDDGYCEV